MRLQIEKNKRFRILLLTTLNTTCTKVFLAIGLHFLLLAHTFY